MPGPEAAEVLATFERRLPRLALPLLFGGAALAAWCAVAAGPSIGRLAGHVAGELPFVAEPVVLVEKLVEVLVMAGAVVLPLASLALLGRRYGRCDITADHALFRPIFAGTRRPLIVIALEAVQDVRPAWGGLEVRAPDVLAPMIAWLVPAIVPAPPTEAERAIGLLCARRDQAIAAGSDAWFSRALAVMTGAMVLLCGLALVTADAVGEELVLVQVTLDFIALVAAAAWQDQRGRRVAVGNSAVSVGHFSWRLAELDRISCVGGWVAAEGADRWSLAWVGDAGPRLREALATRLADRPGVLQETHAPWVGRNLASPYAVGAAALTASFLLGPGVVLAVRLRG